MHFKCLVYSWCTTNANFPHPFLLVLLMLLQNYAVLYLLFLVDKEMQRGTENFEEKENLSFASSRWESQTW